MRSARCAGFLLAAVLAASLVDAAGQPVPDSTHRVYFRGCSFVPPEGENWVAARPGGSISGRLQFAKSHRDGDVELETSVGILALNGSGSRNRDELLATVRRDMQSRNFPMKGDQLLGLDVTPDSLAGLDCVRFHYRFMRPPGKYSPAIVKSVYGIKILHPDAPRLEVTLYHAQAKVYWNLARKKQLSAAAAEPAQPPSPEGEAFLRTLRFVPRDLRCQYSDTLGFNGPQGVATGYGSVWVSQIATGEVLRIDPATGHVTARIGVGHQPTGLAIGEGAVWVVNKADATVSRIDAAANQVVANVKVGKDPLKVTVAAGAVWVANTADGTVSRIDPATNQARGKPIKVGRGACAVLYHNGIVWVAAFEQDRVLRIDPQTNAIVGNPIDVGEGPNDLAVGAGSIWVNCQGETPAVFRIDPATGALLATIPSTRYPGGIAFGHDKLWLCDYEDGTIATIDPAHNTIVGEPVHAGISLVFALAAEDGLWVTDQIGATVIRLPFE